MRLLYDAGIRLYSLAIRVAALWNTKAARWLTGRKNWQSALSEAAGRLPTGRRVWIHCASLGEYEQGLPLIGSLQKSDPSLQVILTFFSPSGYDVVHDKSPAAIVAYLPADTAWTARTFLDIVRPDAAVFVKYEFWYHYLRELRERNVLTILASGAFREGQIFFRKNGAFFRGMLRCFSHFFVQDESSAALLESVHIDRALITVSGDTRYDRVKEIAATPRAFPLVEQFVAGRQVVIGGSTWPEDELLLRDAMKELAEDTVLILAPHEIHEPNLKRIEGLFGSLLQRYSRLEHGVDPEGRVLLIDNIGMLSSLYRYGRVAWVGGGFHRSGIHNVLEPAVFGLPVICGPHMNRFVEAVALRREGLLFVVAGREDAQDVLKLLLADERRLGQLSASLRSFVAGQLGAAEKIADYLLRCTPAGGS